MLETARERARRRWHRFILAWMMGSALWLAVLLIAQAAIRPAPEFFVIAPLLIGAPALALVIGVVLLRWRATR